MLSRYKFVGRMLQGENRVFEVGCGDGTGGRVVKPMVERLLGCDRDADIIQHAPFMTFQWDILDGPPDIGCEVDAVYAIDFLEHVQPYSEDLALENMRESLTAYGKMIVGMPSIESQPYASSISLAHHVNCKTEDGLRETMLQHFHSVFIFGQNDEVVHTGFGPMCQYRWALCSGKR